MMPHKCPVCNGLGQVQGSFYGNMGTGGAMQVPCRSCNGTGVIWETGGVIFGHIDEHQQKINSGEITGTRKWG